MIQVTFNFDPETNKVSDVSVTTTGDKPVVTKKSKSKTSDNKVILKGSSLKLNQDVLDLMGVKVGDRICVRFNPGPVLVRTDIGNELKGGNLITKSLTVSVKGKTGETLAKFGEEFEYNLQSEGYLLLTTNELKGEDPTTESTEDTLEDQPLQQDTTNLLDDLDFINAIEDGEEIDFKFQL